jgi:hypothetical protein
VRGEHPFLPLRPSQDWIGDIEFDVDLPVYGSTMVEVLSGRIRKSFPTPFPLPPFPFPDAAEDPAADR